MGWLAIPCVTSVTSALQLSPQSSSTTATPHPLTQILTHQIERVPIPSPQHPTPTSSFLRMISLAAGFSLCALHGHQRGFFSLVSCLLISTQPCSDNSQAQIPSFFYSVCPDHHCLPSFRFPISNSHFIPPHCSCFLWRNYLIFLSMYSLKYRVLPSWVGVRCS